MCAPVCVPMLAPMLCVCECTRVHQCDDIDVSVMAWYSVTYSLDLLWEQEDGKKELCVCVGN